VSIPNLLGNTTNASVEASAFLKNEFRRTALVSHFIDVGNYEEAERYMLELIEVLSSNLGERHGITDEFRAKLSTFYELYDSPERANEYRLKYDLNLP